MSEGLDKILLILETFYGVKYGYNIGRKFYLLENFPERWRRIGGKYAAKKLSYLKQKGYLSAEKEKTGKRYKLTPRGLIKLIRLRTLKNHKIGTPLKPDKKYKILFFDIPENRKKERDRFRKFLKELGFHELQRSIFLSNLESPRELDAVLDFLGIREYALFGNFEPDCKCKNLLKIKK
ncbi:MAG: CRISPR-associated endonuclease Cas2 [Elusimicrobia bacterium CG08_land_8_20_14_0_20_51_18]|nr:MAG: CRISPR-associated endonuclease Cas2 [Elusimicrobia bacterium CG08_land_8_20_14_0_20_51_18]